MSRRIFLVGGGPSLKGFSFKQLSQERTIAVNAAIFDLRSADYFITMDYTFLSRRVHNMKKAFRAIDTTCVFVCGFHHEYLKEKRGLILDTRNKLLYRLEDYHLIIKSYNPHGCGFTFKDFRSGENSGYCAFQLAVLLGFDEIYLLGFDMVVENTTHYHDLYPNQRNFDLKLKQYAKNFRVGIKDVQDQTDICVVSCSPISSLNDTIPYIPIEDVLK